MDNDVEMMMEKVVQLSPAEIKKLMHVNPDSIQLALWRWRERYRRLMRFLEIGAPRCIIMEASEAEKEAFNIIEKRSDDLKKLLVEYKLNQDFKEN